MCDAVPNKELEDGWTEDRGARKVEAGVVLGGADPQPCLGDQAGGAASKRKAVQGETGKTAEEEDPKLALSDRYN